MKLTKKMIEKKYNCHLIKDFAFEDERLFWVAYENESDNKKFVYADGWTLKELIENIEKRIIKGDIK